MTQKKIVINISKQTLQLLTLASESGSNPLSKTTVKTTTLIKEYCISTGKNGTGCQEGTGQTPLGEHRVAEKIGEGQPINMVFVGRIPTGEVYSEKLGRQMPDRDWILSRILWLSGTESGYNQGENSQGLCDTYQRYIYIHGTPDTEPMGVPESHGCIRMRNLDVIELFDLVTEDTLVQIELD